MVIALAMGLAATSIFGRDIPDESYGYPYGCDYGVNYRGYDFCTDPGPHRRDVPLGDDFALGGRFTGAFLTGGGLPFNARVSLDEEDSGPTSPSDWVPVASFFDVTIVNLTAPGTGETGPFNPPLELTIEVPDFVQNVPDTQLRASFYKNGAWRGIPRLGIIQEGGAPPAFPTAEDDGFYIEKFADGRRTINILTRHLTLFGVFRDPPNQTGGGGGSTGGGGGGGGGATDSVAPRATLSGRKTQDPVKQKGVLFVDVLPTESGKAAAAGRVKVRKSYRLKGSRKSVKAGRKTRMRVKIRKKHLRKVKKALRRKKKVRAKVSVTLRDAAGNKRTIKRTIKLKRGRKR